MTTARTLFAERGYDGCSVSDIAKQAGMSQGNIYWYFSSKAELLKAILVQGFETLGVMMEDAASQSGTGLEKLDILLTRFLALARESRGDEFITIVVTIIGQGGVQRLSEMGTDTLEVATKYQQAVATILAQGQADGTIDPAIDVTLLTTFFFSFLNGLMFMYPKEWRDISEETIRDAVLRLVASTRK